MIFEGFFKKEQSDLGDKWGPELQELKIIELEGYNYKNLHSPNINDEDSDEEKKDSQYLEIN